MTALEVVDNGHSYGGVYGIANNDYALWMINRGYGELVALTPEELQKAPTPPLCSAPASHVDGRTGKLVDERYGRPCTLAMHWRGSEWVCYHHAEPVRLRIPPRLQQIPAFPGGLEALAAVADKTVDCQYWTPSPGVIPPRWTYFVDGEPVS